MKNVLAAVALLITAGLLTVGGATALQPSPIGLGEEAVVTAMAPEGSAWAWWPSATRSNGEEVTLKSDLPAGLKVGDPILIAAFKDPLTVRTWDSVTFTTQAEWAWVEYAQGVTGPNLPLGVGLLAGAGIAGLLAIKTAAGQPARRRELVHA